MLDQAKGKAASVNRTAAETMDKLSTIERELDKISVAPGDGNLNNVLSDVDQSSEIQEFLLTSASLYKLFYYKVLSPAPVCSHQLVEKHSHSQHQALRGGELDLPVLPD